MGPLLYECVDHSPFFHWTAVRLPLHVSLVHVHSLCHKPAQRTLTSWTDCPIPGLVMTSYADDFALLVSVPSIVEAKAWTNQLSATLERWADTRKKTTDHCSPKSSVFIIIISGFLYVPFQRLRFYKRHEQNKRRIGQERSSIQQPHYQCHRPTPWMQESVSMHKSPTQLRHSRMNQARS